MHVYVATVDLHLPAVQSLKQKRSTVVSLVRQLDQLHGVGAAEVGHLDLWQRSLIGVSIVAESAGHAEAVMGSVDRLVWSRPEIEVLNIEYSWWEGPS